MPTSKKPARTSGNKRSVSKPRQPMRPGANRKPDQSLRTQIRGGRPPRFPGRTGGR